VPGNGSALHTVLVDLIGQRDEPLARWAARELACPCTMVDRIVPASTENDRRAALERIGLQDDAAVATEPFSQWVIEDRFAGARPCFEESGAILVSDVAPFETAKLRLLNGSHSTLAYLGSLAGYEFVHEAMQWPELNRTIRHLMKTELAPTLDPAPNFDIDEYQCALITRFENAALPHRLLQIAMDGSQKLPQRLIAPLRYRIQHGQSFDVIALAVAAWMRHVSGFGEQGRHDVVDPLAARLAHLASTAGSDASALTKAFLSEAQIFGPDLPEQVGFVATVSQHLETIISKGVRSAVHDLQRSLIN
jgi:fructuronate reductase